MKTEIEISIRAIRRKLKIITDEKEKNKLRDELDKLKKLFKEEKVSA